MVPVTSTAQTTSSARARTALIASKIAPSSLTTFADHKVVPASSIKHTQWWPFPTSTPAQPRTIGCCIDNSPSNHTTVPWPQGTPADRSVNSDQNAHLNQQ